MLVAALVFTMLNTSRIGTARVGLSAVLSAAVLLYAASGHLITSRRPDSAERMLAAFAARLTEELDADAVTEDLARSVHTALEPAHISIWLSEPRA